MSLALAPELVEPSLRSVRVEDGADQPLADICAEFGVRTPVDPDDGHHLFW